MHARRLMLTATLAALLGTMMGCDSEPADDDDDGDAATSENADDDGSSDGDGPTPKSPDGRTKTADPAPAGGATACGNGLVDAGEDCDDGPANGANRECTSSCTLNACELDEDGRCDEPHWPAADVDYQPFELG